MKAIVASGLQETDTLSAFSYNASFSPAWLNSTDFNKSKLASYTTVVVKMQAASVQPADIMYVDGTYKHAPVHPLPKYPCPLGVDGAGVVVHTASHVTKWKVGDAVLGLHMRMDEGCWAEYATFEERELASRPPTMPVPVAAALPVACLTAFCAFMCCPELQQYKFSAPDSPPWQRVLINGASGGVGGWATLLASRYFRIPTIIATCSEPNVEYVKSLGAHVVIDYRSQDIWEEVTKVGKEQCKEERPLDGVIDCVGGIVFLKPALEATKAGGCVVTSVPVGDRSRPKAAGSLLQFAGYWAKRKLMSTFVGGCSHLRFNGAYPGTGVLQHLADTVDKLAPCSKAEDFPLRITCLPIEQGMDALKVVASGRAVGKQVLLIDQQ